jgi:hypothetical protein
MFGHGGQVDAVGGGERGCVQGRRADHVIAGGQPVPTVRAVPGDGAGGAHPAVALVEVVGGDRRVVWIELLDRLGGISGSHLAPNALDESTVYWTVD